MTDTPRCPVCGRTEGMTDNEPCSTECGILSENEILKLVQGTNTEDQLNDLITRAVELNPRGPFFEALSNTARDYACGTPIPIASAADILKLQREAYEQAAEEISLKLDTIGDLLLNAEVAAWLAIVGLRIKPLVWHNFGVYCHWAESVSGTYYVEERNGGWRVELRVGGLVHFISETDTTTQEDLSAAQAAAEADNRARILPTLEVAE